MKRDLEVVPSGTQHRALCVKCEAQEKERDACLPVNTSNVIWSGGYVELNASNPYANVGRVDFGFWERTSLCDDEVAWWEKDGTKRL